jgi:predicted O-methyltransferase YrrM
MYAEYLNGINKKETSEVLVSLRLFALENDVPIVTNDGIHFLNQIIKLRNATRILEIGSAIGYSSINMALHNKDVTITTIERDPKMISIATKNIKDSGLEDRITLIQGDALEISEENLGEFDVVFIDAAKAQSSKFFNKYKPNLCDRGVIVTDNLIFHGLVVAEIKEKNLRQLVRKIDEFNHFVVEQSDFDTYIYNVGDGMSVSIKK